MLHAATLELGHECCTDCVLHGCAARHAQHFSSSRLLCEAIFWCSIGCRLRCRLHFDAAKCGLQAAPSPLLAQHLNYVRKLVLAMLHIVPRAHIYCPVLLLLLAYHLQHV